MNDYPMAEDNEMPEDEFSENEGLESLAQILTVGHAMTDYLRSNPDAFRAFCEFVKLPEDKTDDMRVSVDVTHDAFAMMASRARAEAGIAQIIDVLGSATL